MSYERGYYRKRNEETGFIKKTALQLVIVCLFIFPAVFLKISDNDMAKFILSSSEKIISKDYTAECSSVLKVKRPNFTGLWSKAAEKFGYEGAFYMQEMPVSSNGAADGKPSYKEAAGSIVYSVKKGTPVQAVFRGKVESVSSSKENGIELTIEHEGGYKSIYSNLSEVRVSEGEAVFAGDTIALSGKSLLNGKEFMQFTITKNDVTVNPKGYFAAGTK